MIYHISHVTRFRYSAPISESVSEVHLQPITEGNQRCLSFDLKIAPKARVMNYRDHFGNIVHHFDIARSHNALTISAESVVEVTEPPQPGATAGGGDWDQLDEAIEESDLSEMLLPSKFTEPTRLLHEFAAEIRFERNGGVLETVRRLSAAIYRKFEYVPRSTRVDSPIDDALRSNRGVCQDFSHIMLALLRTARIPCRYVSGYLFHRVEDHDRSEADASHAWVEVLVPGHGWVGLDPTNNLMAGPRHIKVAVGRDYADVPPTKGLFKGDAESELSVAVTVGPADSTIVAEELNRLMNWSRIEMSEFEQLETALTQQQQQQQQQ